MTRSRRWIFVEDSPFLPARGGGEREHLGMLRAAAAQGVLAAVVLPAEGPVDLAPYREELGDVPVVVVPRRTSPVRLLHPTRPYVVASRPPSADLVARVRAVAPDATAVVVTSYKSHRIGEVLARGLGLPAVVRQHNREGAYHRSLADSTPGPRGWVLRWEAWRIDRDERRLGRAGWVRGTADISADDAAWRRSTGAREVVHVPPFAALPGDLDVVRTADGRGRVLFLGALDVGTNVAAVEWLLARVWPRVRAVRADAALDVVGRSPDAAVRRATAQAPGVALHADVPDVRPYLAAADVAVNPAVTGSGVNIKLVEYLAAGVPLVSTSLATRGLPLEPGTDLEVADAPEAFADAVLRLLADPVAAAAMAARGRAHLAEITDPRRNLEVIAALLEGPQDGRIAPR